MTDDLPPGAGGTPTALHGPARTTGDTPRNRLAAAVRRVSAAAVGHPVPRDDLAAAAEQLEKLAADLEAAGGETKAPRIQPDPLTHPQDFFATSPVIGYANPLAPPVDFWAVEGEGGLKELRGRANYGYAYEGPPTCVHGGVIAELFDELLGSVNILVGRGGFTGTLTVRYRRPTPLLADLDLVARSSGTEGRKQFAWGGIYYEGQLTAEAEGIFIEVGADKMAAIVGANAAASSATVLDPNFARFIEERAREQAAGDGPGS